MGLKKVDVLIPCAGNAEYFEEAIDSALKQNYKKLEIYVIDNASDHNKYKYIAEGKYLPNIHYIRFNKRLSMTENWQRCLTVGDSEYIAFLHDDDVWLPNYVANCMSRFTVGDSAEICLTGHLYFSGNIEEINLKSVKTLRNKINIINSYTEPLRSFIISTSNSGHMSALLFRRTPLGFPINSRWIPDQEYLAAYIGYNNLLINSEILVYIRLSNSNITASVSKKGFISLETINHLRRTTEFYIRNKNLTPQSLIDEYINSDNFDKEYYFRLLQACFSWPLRITLINFGTKLIKMNKGNTKTLRKNHLVLKFNILVWIAASLAADLKYFLKDLKNKEV